MVSKRIILYALFAIPASIPVYGVLMFGGSLLEVLVNGVVIAAIGYYVVNAP